MSEFLSLPPLVKRPSTHLDDIIQNHHTIDFFPSITGKDVVTDTEIVDNLLFYLSKLDLEKPENLTSVNNLRDELSETEKAEQAAKDQKQQTEEPAAEGEEGGESQELDFL